MMIARAWGSVTDFIERFNMIPLVIVVSVYHYAGALNQHDPIWVAIPLAIFLDLLHYRTVKQAVTRGGLLWLVIGLATTAVAFGMQYMFYSDGDLLLWQALMFSALVPIGLAIMAYHTAVHEQDDWRTIEEFEAALNDREDELNQNEAKLNDREDALNQNEAKLKDREDEIKKREAELRKVEREMKRRLVALAKDEDVLARLREFEAMVKAMNPVARDVAGMLAFKNITGAEIAAKHDVATGTVSGIKKTLNGHKA